LNPIAQKFIAVTSELFRSLTAKVIVLSAILIIVISILIWCPSIVHIQKEEFNKSLKSAESQVELIKMALHHGMLTNNREFLQETVESVSKAENISSIRIFGMDSRVYFSSQKSEIGTASEAVISKDKAWSIKEINGERMLRVVEPIHNTQACYTAACHFHTKDQTILGVIESEFSLQAVDIYIRKQGFTAAAFGFVFTAILAGFLYLILCKFILKPLSVLTDGVQRVTSGDLSHTIEINTKDEMGRLANAFNAMTVKLKEKKDVMEKELDEYRASLLQAQKMEAVGLLAGGIAHNFNNILTAIIGYGNLVLIKMNDNDPLKEHVEHILFAADRAANLTKSLLAFSRKELISLNPIDLHEIIKKVKKLLLSTIREDIELRTALVDKPLTVMADSVQLEHVLLNLAINARDAMPDGGILTIETGFEELNAVYTKTHDLERPGTYAYISVTDTGVGIDERIREKIFEPFFTTKEVGKGTGLGLAGAFGIIKQHNGNIKVYSEVGKGTKFKIYLPLMERI